VLTGVAAVWLTVRQKIWCWPVGLVNVTLFAVVFARARLYADAGLQGIYFALAIYGWWAWLHGGTDHGPLVVTRSPRREWLPLAAGAAVAALLLGTLLHRHTDASFPFLDSALTTGSLAAQWLQARKRLANWTVWIGVDLVYVGMYIAKGLHLTALLYAGFTLLAITGLREWRRAMGVGEG